MTSRLFKRLMYEKHHMQFSFVYADHPDRKHPVRGGGYAYKGWRRTDIPVEVRLMERSAHIR